MTTRNSILALAAAIGACSAAASAAIIPSWRVNPISPAAIASRPELASYVCISLVVQLTGNSMFNVAGLDLTQVSFYSGLDFYNDPVGGNGPTNTAFFPIFPAVEFDSYVSTTIRTAAAVPGRLNGTGEAQVADGNVFNVAWGATPNTGPIGGVNLEIARITVRGHIIGLTSVPLSAGRVRDSVNPNADVALPSMPLVVPEPTAVVIAAGGALMIRRRRRSSDTATARA